MKTNLMLATLMLAVCAYAQRGHQSDLVIGDSTPVGLNERITGSQLVIVGTVSGIQSPEWRNTEEEKSERDSLARQGQFEEMTKVGRSGNDEFLRIFTVQVKRTLCQQSDFAGGRRIDIPETIYIIDRTPDARDGFDNIFLLTGKRYLLFLDALTEQEQKFWSVHYDFAERPYYRIHTSAAKPPSRRWFLNAVDLSDRNNAANPKTHKPYILEWTEAFCEAFQPADPNQKIAALNRLSNTHSELRDEVDEAKKSLQVQK